MERWEQGRIMSISNGNNVMSTPRVYKEYPLKPKCRPKHVWLVEIAFIGISLLTFLLDVVTDILVSIDYLQKGEVVWGSLTIALVIVPAIVIQIISACWYKADKSTRGATCWLSHLLLMQPLERYLSVLVTGAEAQTSGKEEDTAAYHYQMNDVCMLRLFEAFLESAPQLTLQLYVICCTDSASWLSCVCAMMSMLAVGWAVASYSHALRQAYKEQYRAVWIGLLLQTFWHMAMAGVRVLCLVAFASVFKAWVFLVMGVHWMVMTTWVMLQNTDFCPTTIQERFFNAIVGVIYGFSFFNLKEGRSRYRMTAFYIIMFVENAALLVTWYFFRDPTAWYNTTILYTVPTGFVFGLLCMLTYYRFFHPSGPIYLREPKVTPQQKPAMICSPIEIPRRATMLKQSSSLLLPILFKEVSGPLSPISSSSPPTRPHLYTDCSLQLNDSSGFQHYSVDASACIDQPTTTMRNFAGITLSEDSDDDSLDSSPPTSPYSISSSSSSSSCSSMRLESPSLSPSPAVRSLSYKFDSCAPPHTEEDAMQRQRLLFVDPISQQQYQCYNPPNSSIQYIDATDTETVGDSDGDILDMSDIHFSYLRTKPRSDTK